MRPFAHLFGHPSLWHLNRRSGPKAIAIGLFAGFILPFGQFLLAALLSAPLRANVPLAAAATLVSNPITFPPIYFAAYRCGRALLGNGGSVAGNHGRPGYLTTLVELSGPTALGLIIFAVISAVGGYLLGKLWWNWRLVKLWKSRRSSSVSYP